MTLPASGPLTLSDIQTEFGGTNPIGMNEYYAGGGLVPAGTSGTYGAVPSSGAISIRNFYGTSNFVPVYIQDVFSDYLYAGNSSSQNINNGINLLSKSGLVWLKGRNSATGNFFTDTLRGTNKIIESNWVGAQYTSTDALNAFNSNGFSIGSGNSVNTSGTNYVSWTFREQPKFFTILTYTGTGINTPVPHNLGSAPGCVIVKNINTSSNWGVWHRNTGNANESVLGISLNTTNGAASTSGSQAYSTSTTFDYQGVYDYTGSAPLNVVGQTYIAYLFAHDAGGFGATGTDNVISCGSFVSSISGLSVYLGYQPQWLMVKTTSSVGLGWYIVDSQRGFTLGSTSSQALTANSASSEGSFGWFTPTSTGFNLNPSQISSGFNFIYIAIRAPM